MKTIHPTRYIVTVGLAFGLVCGTAYAATPRIELGNSTGGALSSSADAHTAKTIKSLRDKAISSGSVRVILGVRAAFAAEGELPESERRKQRDDIGLKQNAVLDKLPKLKAKTGKIKRFESIPFMALEVSLEELDSLIQNRDVTHITEDEISRPALLESVPLIGGTTAWSSGHTGAGQVIAVLDSGVDKNHPALSGKVADEACYSTNSTAPSTTSLCPGGVSASTATGSALPYAGACPSGQCGHGTHVAGIAAGNGSNDGLGYSGVAKHAQLIAIQVFTRFNSDTQCGAGKSPCALTFVSDSILGLERVYALRNSYSIAVVNMSIGGGSGYSSQSDCDSANSAQKAVMDNLRAANIATVVASGNNGYTSSMSAPACISSAISVGATTKSDVVASYSNSAYFLNLLAPGSSIVSALPGGGYASASGTSMAAPHVAGAWAILRQKMPTISVGDALDTLAATGVAVTDARNSVTKPRIQIASAPAIASVATRVAAGLNHSCAVISGGVKCWGRNAFGRLGNGSTSDSSVPVTTITASSAATAVAAGGFHSCAVVSGGAKCWGDNLYGQLGNGGTASYSTIPVTTFTANSGVTAVAAGYEYNCAVVSGGVKCWGDNLYGQLGTGGYSNSLTPVTVIAAGNGVTAVAAGLYHSCAVVSGGVKCWGDNLYGQLGTGNYSNSLTPVTVIAAGSGVTAIAAGDAHTCAVIKAGVKCWGSNQYGQLGTGGPFYSSIPVTTFTANSGVTAIAAGAAHSCAVVSGGVKCWGDNLYGQLGTGGYSSSLTPATAIAASSGVTAIAAGDVHSCAVINARVQCWGENLYGKLGDGSGAGSPVPVNVAGIAGYPDSFYFSPVIQAALSSPITSNAVTLFGSSPLYSISVSGGEYNINGGAYTGAPGTVYSGQSVSLRLTSSSSYSTTTQATLNVGGLSRDFYVTTLHDTTPNAFTFTARRNARPGILVTSNPITVAGITTGVPISIVGGTYSLNGGAYTSVAGTVNAGDTVRVQRNAALSGLAQTTLTVGGVNGIFRIRTRFDGRDFQTDGKSDILWRNSTTGANVIWKSANSATPQAVASQTNLAWKAACGGDFDGDGFADILWRNSTTGSNVIWKRAISSTTQAVTGRTDLAWQVVGCGDYNGDGKADILWRHSSTGANAIWKSASSATSQAVTARADLNWKVAGTGDFNGDGKSDILWRHSTTGANAIWKSANSATSQAVTTQADLNWQVAGAGDFNNDGKADILWRNTSTGENGIWESAASATPLAVNPQATTWSVAGTGDYNFDNKADILWRNPGTGENAIWLSANSATLQTISTQDVGWQIQ